MMCSSVVTGKIRVIIFSKNTEKKLDEHYSDDVTSVCNPSSFLDTEPEQHQKKTNLCAKEQNEHCNNLSSITRRRCSKKLSKFYQTPKKHKFKTYSEYCTSVDSLRKKHVHINKKSSQFSHHEVSGNQSFGDSDECKKNVSKQHFKCQFCCESFTTLINLNTHKKTHMHGRQLECIICQKSYSHRDDLNVHMQVHINEQLLEDSISRDSFPPTSSYPTNDKSLLSMKPFECKICQKWFTERDKLNDHAKIHVDEIFECEPHEKALHCKNLLEEGRILNSFKIFKCDTCSEHFSHLSQLKKHNKIHIGKKAYECPVCSKSFSIISNLRRHEKLHTGIKPFQCDTCHKQFSEKSILIEHIRIHTGEKPFECEVCHKKFTQRGTLIEHRRTHTGERRFVCGYCQKQFCHKSDLNKHVRIHTGEKPFECSECYKRFSRSDFLNIHKQVHVGIKTFLCDLCPNSYMSRSGLTKHKKAAHLPQTDVHNEHQNSNSEKENDLVPSAQPL